MQKSHYIRQEDGKSAEAACLDLSRDVALFRIVSSKVAAIRREDKTVNSR